MLADEQCHDPYFMRFHTTQYVTGFGKTYIVHTSDFEYFDIYKNHSDWCTELKLSGQLEE